jgi:maleate cis-trans isomerase
MYGWRARIGLIIAHGNTTMEPEFNRVAPEGVSIHAARVAVGERTLEGFANKDQRLENAIRLLGDMNIRSYGH